MEAKIKAKELIEKFKGITGNRNQAINCAIVAVDEILSKDGYNNDYWKQVKDFLIHSLYN